MKKIYKVNNIFSEAFLGGGRSFRLTERRSGSRISPINHRLWTVIAPMLLVAFGLFGVNVEMWGGTGYARVNASASPLNWGYVYVGTGTNGSTSSPSQSSDYAENNTYQVLASETNVPFRLCAKAVDGYGFTAWRENGSSTNASQSNPWDISVIGGDRDKHTSGPWYNQTTTYTVKSQYTYTYTAIFDPVTVNSVSSNPISSSTNALKITQPGASGAKTENIQFTVSSNADAMADFDEPTVSGDGWEYVESSISGTTVTVSVKYTATTTTTQGDHTATVTLTSKGTSENQSRSATVYANVDLTPTISVDPTSYNFGMFTVGVDEAKSKKFTLTLNANAVTITTTDNASIAPFSVTRNGNTLTVSYNPTSVGSGSYSKTLRVTATNGQASAISAYQDITLQGQAQATTHPTYECSIASDYMVDDENTIDLQDLWTSNSTGSITYSIKSFTPANSNDVATTPAISNNRYLSIGQAGTVELRLKQTAVTGFYADSTFKTITIHKYTSTFSQVSNLATTVGSTTSSNYTLTYVKPNAAYVETTAPAAAGTPGLGSSSGNFYYTLGHKVTTDKQTGCPDQYKTVAMTYAADTKIATGRNQGVDTVHLYQKETYKYTSTSASFVVSVSKLSNTLKANNSDDYSVDMYVDSTQNVTLTATNTDYTNCPISVSPIVVGDSLYATYAYNQASHSGTVTSRHYINKTIKWRFTQPENYKYLAGCDTFSVKVVKLSEEACYIYDNSNVGGKTAEQLAELGAIYLGGIGDVMTYQMHYNVTVLGNEVNFQSSTDGTNWTKEKVLATSSSGYTDNDPITLPSGTRYIKFTKYSSDNPYLRNIKVTRKTYLNIGTDSNTTNQTLTINKKSDNSAIYPGQKGQKATIVYWGITNGGNLKIKCEDPRFSFSQNTITNGDCNSGTTDITVYYTDTIAGTATAEVLVYNDVFRQTFTVKGVIEKAKQNVTWNYDVVRYNDTISNAVSATVSPVTYESANSNIIKVIKDNLNQNTILVAVDTGTVNITAHVPGNAYYAAIDTVHAIKVTMKQLQTIVWNQSLFDLELGGDNRTLTATATSDVEGCISTRLVEYVSSDPDVVYVTPGTNVLQIKGVGTTTVTAFQRGGWDIDGHEYDSVAVQKTAIVRDPNAPCDNFVYQQPSEYTFGNMGNLVSTETKSSTEIDFGGRVAGESSIYFKGIKRGVTQYYGGTMSVEQYLPAASPHWQTVKSIGTPSTDGYDSVHFVFSREATKMRVTVTNAKGEHVFRDCQIKQARFIETTTPANFNINVGASEDQTIYLSYSNVVGNISFTLGQENSSFSVNRTVITDTCGGHAKNVAVVITYNPQQEVQNEQDVLTISDGTTSCEVILKGSATRVGRTITWNHADVRSIYTVEKDTLIAEARTSLNEKAGTVEFTYVNNTSTANGSIDANNILSFTSAGTAYVVANTPNHDYYFPAATVGPKRWDVALTPTEVVDAPTIGSVVSGTALSDITVSGGTARNTINQGSVSGTFTVQNGNVTDVGQHTATLLFAPEDGTMYDVCTYNMYIEVIQREATDEEIGTVTAGHITFGEKLSDAVLSMSGTLNGHGTLVMTDPQKDEVKDVDTYENLKVLFTPDNTNIAPKELTVSVTVDEANPAVTPQATDITYGQPISASSITTASGDVAGSWAWAVDDTQVLSVGDHVLKANFTSDSANYNNLSNVDVTLTVNKIETLEVEVPLSFCAGESETFHGETYTIAGTDQINAVGATRDTVYNVTVTVLQPTTGTDSKTIVCGASESWNGIDLSGYAVGSHSVEAVMTNAVGCDSTVTLTLTVSAPVNEFTNAAGDGDWQNPANWTSVPTGSEPNVIVSGALEIDENVTVGNLTIENTGGVTVITNGTLTVKGTSEDRSEYGDVHVLNDGAIHLGSSADLQVRHFTLDAKLAGKNILDVKEAAASGQVDSVSNLHVNGDAYFQMTFDPKGKISFGWYDFVVPFPVNISDGIYREGNLTSHLVSGVDFLVQEYSETRNANKQKAWSNFYGTLQPGRVYTITFNYDPNFDQNVFVFKKASGAAIGGPMEFATQYTAGSGDTDDCGWNGLGNGTLQHGYITGTYAKMQVYNHAENKYDLLTGKNPSFAVGTSFFVQVGEAHPTMEWNKTEDYDVNPLYAPKREAVEVEEFLLSLRGENQVDASDHLYFSGSEEATEEYVIGHDLRKMGNPTEAKTAQMWATKNGKKLCDIETRMVNYDGSSDLLFYAPEAGTFELTVEEMPENATLYLTKNGRAVWNLSMNPCELDLTKGTTEGYGLRIVADRQTTTDVENAETENGSVRKVLIDDKIYIVTPEGKMYDIVGKSVKY